MVVFHNGSLLICNFCTLCPCTFVLVSEAYLHLYRWRYSSSLALHSGECLLPQLTQADAFLQAFIMFSHPPCLNYSSIFSFMASSPIRCFCSYTSYEVLFLALQLYVLPI
jgi:hypothetical protein